MWCVWALDRGAFMVGAGGNVRFTAISLPAALAAVD